MTGIYLAKNQLQDQHIDKNKTEGLGQGERYGGEPQGHLICDWTHVSTTVYSMTGCMGTVTTGLSSSAWKKVHKQGYFVTRVKVVKIEYCTVVAPGSYWKRDFEIGSLSSHFNHIFITLSDLMYIGYF